jgi:hypothetical protein
MESFPEEPKVQRDIPPEEDLQIPEEVNEESIVYFMEIIGNIAQDFGLDALTSPPIEIARPESIDDFIHELETKIKASDRETAEKEGALKVLKTIVNQLHTILQAVRNS